MGLVVAAACALTFAAMGWAAGLLVAAMVVSYGLWIGRMEWPATARVVPVYLAAVVVQCAHLAEEYATGFHRAFPPVLGAEPWSGGRFLAFNLAWLAVFAAGGVALARGKRSAYLVALFLALGGGIGNGLGHLALAARAGGYFPGAYTGVLALVVGSLLAYRLLRDERDPSSGRLQR
ncbi:MAG: hypothetical protein ACJ8J0_23270 [Longimicrobiaceae bacterium]